MGSLVVRLIAAIAAAALSLTIFGYGIASADDPLVGKTYSDAEAQISKVGGKAVIGTVTGNQLALDDCIVASWRQAKFRDSSGRNLRGDEWTLNLNCNDIVATPGHPGNSAASPAGVQAKEWQKNAEAIAKQPEFCEKNDETMQWCKTMCKSTGLCDVV